MIVSTQPSEPYAELRYNAIRQSVNLCRVVHFNQEIEQNPEAPGFWEMWKAIFINYGFQPGDYIVASESYGQQLAEKLGGVFVPYDLHRTVTPVKATLVRNRPIDRFDQMIPEFRKHFVSRVTIFGAESTGKTTLTRELAKEWNAPWLFEWARPYLESVGAEVTEEKMQMIWKGQRALQESAKEITDSPVIFQDTDLFSTIGYWEMFDPGIRLSGQDAIRNQSDLYLITPSNIPFEPDILRYGGDKRETDDQYWIDLCEQTGLPYKVLTSNTVTGRVAEASEYVAETLRKRLDLRYDRQHN